MDQDRDGTISMDDLKEVYASLGTYARDAVERQHRSRSPFR